MHKHAPPNTAAAGAAAGRFPTEKCKIHSKQNEVPLRLHISIQIVDPMTYIACVLFSNCKGFQMFRYELALKHV